MALSTQPLSQATGIVYVVLGLDLNQTVPSFIGWADTLIDVQLAADDYVAKNPRLRAMILESSEYINATASLRSLDAKTGEERKRPVPEAVRQ